MANTVLQNTDTLPLQPVLFTLTGPVLHRLADAHRRPDAVDHPGGDRLRPDAAPVRRRDDARRRQVAHPLGRGTIDRLEATAPPSAVCHPEKRSAMPIQNMIINCTDVSARSTTTPSSSTPQWSASRPPSAPSSTGDRDARAAGRRQRPRSQHLGRRRPAAGLPPRRVQGRPGRPAGRRPQGRRGRRSTSTRSNAEGGGPDLLLLRPGRHVARAVEGDLQYAQVLDADGVAAERALGVPERPRFDHVAVTVDDRGRPPTPSTPPLRLLLHRHHRAAARPPGVQHRLPQVGRTVLEVFTYEADKQTREPQPDVAGFGWAPSSPATAPTDRRRPAVVNADRGSDRAAPTPTASCSPPPTARPRDARPGSDDWVRPAGLHRPHRCGRGRRRARRWAACPRTSGTRSTHDDGVALVRVRARLPCPGTRHLQRLQRRRERAADRPAIKACGGLPADFLVATKVDARGRDYSGARVRASVAESQGAARSGPPAAGLPARPRVPRLRRAVGPRRRRRHPDGAARRGRDRARRAGRRHHPRDAALPRPRRLRGAAGAQPLDPGRPQRRASWSGAGGRPRASRVVNAAVYGGGMLAKPGRAPRSTATARPAGDTGGCRGDGQGVCAEHGTDLATAALPALGRTIRGSRGTVVGLSRPARLDALLEPPWKRDSSSRARALLTRVALARLPAP